MGPHALFWGIVIVLSIMLKPIFDWLDKLTGSRREVGVALFVAFLIAVGGGVWALVVLLVSHQAERADLKRSLESNLGLVEVYPHYHWKLTGQTGGAPYPLENTTLSEKFIAGSEYRLTPMVRNWNDGIPLFDPEMIIYLPSEIGVKPPTMWRPLDPQRSLTVWWAAQFTNQVPGRSIRGIDESLFLTFPRADIYPVRYQLRGLAQNISLERSGTFWLRLVDTP